MSETVEQFFLVNRELDRDRWSLMTNPAISGKFLSQHFTFMRNDCQFLAINPGLTPAFFEEFFNKNPALTSCFSTLSRRDDFPEEFFELHPETIDWRILVGNTNITQGFFELHLNELYHCSFSVWEKLTGNPNLSWHFFERFFANPASLIYGDNLKNIAVAFSNSKPAPWPFVKSLLIQFDISRYKWLSSQSIPIEEVVDIVQELKGDTQLRPDKQFNLVSDIARNTNIPISYIVQKLIPLCNSYYQDSLYNELACRPDVTWNVVKSHILNLDQKAVANLLRQRIPPKKDVLGRIKFRDSDDEYFYTGYVLTNYKLTDDEGDRIIEQLRKLDFFDQWQGYMFFCKNSGLSEDFFEKHIELFRAAALGEFRFDVKAPMSSNPNLTIAFFRRHPEFIIWSFLAQNPFTRQREIDSGFDEETLVRNGQLALREFDSLSLPRLVLDIIRQTIQYGS